MDSHSQDQGSSNAEKPNLLIESSGSGKSHLHRIQRFSLMNDDCLNVIYNDKLLCDVVLITEGKEIPAHKLMLAASSSFFYWKFSKDRYLGLLNRIEIPNLSYETLTAVVRYLYECEILITEQNVEDLSAAAGLFALKDLQSACCEFLKANLNVSNCVRTLRIARQSQYEELIATVQYYMASRFSEFAKQGEFLQMDLVQLDALLASDYLHTSDEEEVLDCVIRWVNYDLQHRKCYIFNLLDNDRILLMSPSNILHRLEAEDWLTSDPQYNVLMLKVLKCHIVDSPYKLKSKQRHSSKCLMVVGVTDKYVLNVKLYDFKKDIWFVEPEIPNIKIDVATRAAILGTTIYVIDGNTLKFFNVSNPVGKEWLKCSDLFDNIEYDKMIACNGMIYTVGEDSDDDLSRVNRIDVTSGVCEEMTSMSISKFDVGLGVLHSNVYAVGGKDYASRRCLNSFEFYHPDSDSWYTMPSMSTYRCRVGVTSLNDTLYVVGGCDSKGYYCKHVEAFNLVQHSWKRLADMNVARANPGIIAINGQLFVFGGYNGNILGFAEVYDPKSNMWTMLSSSMNTAMRVLSVGLVDKADMKL